MVNSIINTTIVSPSLFSLSWAVAELASFPPQPSYPLLVTINKLIITIIIIILVTTIINNDEDDDVLYTEKIVIPYGMYSVVFRYII